MGAERDLSAGEAIGEVVFNTDMTTSQDLLQDPTYSGQIVVQTYPLIGNRGVDPVSPSKFVASGYVVREWCVEPTDAHEFVTLDEYLRGLGIAGLCGVDTRALTRHIRDHGVMNGMIVDTPDASADRMERLKTYRVPPAVGKITVSKPQRWEAERPLYELAIPDYGFRVSILEHFLRRGCSCTLYPAHTPAEDILAAGPDGIVLSDGPGTPGTIRRSSASSVPWRRAAVPCLAGVSAISSWRWPRIWKLKSCRSGTGAATSRCGIWMMAG